MRADVPFQGSMAWRFSPAGTVWTLLTGRYELAEMTTGGEVLRRVTKDHESIPVTAAEREEALKNLEWFTELGGKIDLRKIPEWKPPTVHFFLDDESNLWVQRVVASGADDEGRLFDLFDAEGRYLGTLRLPFPLRMSVPEPIVRKGVPLRGHPRRGRSALLRTSAHREALGVRGRSATAFDPGGGIRPDRVAPRASG